MSKKDRQDRIRKVRSVNDVLDIVSELEKEISADTKTVKKLLVSVSSEEIRIDHAAPGRTRKISTKSRRTGRTFTGTVKNFKSPSKGEIEKHAKVLQRLYDNAKELDSTEAMLRQSFAGIKNQPDALKAVQNLRKTVDASINTALTALNRVATKHFPSEMEDLRDQLTSFLLDSIPEKNYKDMSFLEYVSLGERSEIVFSVYVELEQLINSAGYTFDEYFIVLTGVVNSKGDIAYYVNALPEFRVPGKYPLGRQIDNERDMERHVGMLLAHNDVATELDRVPLPFQNDDDKTKTFKAIKGVTDAKVVDDSLMLEVPKTANKLADEKIAKETIALLNQVMRRKKDAAISWKSVVKGSKRYLKFILYFKPGTASKNLNVMKLNEIKDVFDLDEQQMQKLRRGLLD